MLDIIFHPIVVQAMSRVKLLLTQAKNARLKILTLSIPTFLINLPLGNIRENHTEKFGLEWFLAIHASVPFVWMARKLLRYPPITIPFSITSAIAGQYLGGRLPVDIIDDNPPKEI